MIILILQLFCLAQNIIAQDTLSVEKPSAKGRKEKNADRIDSLVLTTPENSRKRGRTTVMDISNDTLPVPVSLKPVRKGDPMKATMLSAVFPGGGQIFNRKYWKLPIVYGGFGALLYTTSANSKNYQMYYKGYMDFTDDIEETDSYIYFLPSGLVSYDPVKDPGAIPANTTQVEEQMLRLIDYHKRYRDLSIILMGVWYMATILDANVDASLMEYDVSDNLDLSFYPSMMNFPGRSPVAGINLQLTMAF